MNDRMDGDRWYRLAESEWIKREADHIQMFYLTASPETAVEDAQTLWDSMYDDERAALRAVARFSYEHRLHEDIPDATDRQTVKDAMERSLLDQGITLVGCDDNAVDRWLDDAYNRKWRR